VSFYQRDEAGVVERTVIVVVDANDGHVIEIRHS
jgi:hypothetical protein